MSKIPIFFHCSNEYAPTLAVTIASILYNTKSFIDFYVLETDISNFRKKQINSLKNQFNNFEINWISYRENKEFIEKYLDKLHPLNRGRQQWPSVHAFCTPFITKFVEKYDKIIYLDLDLVVLDDIKSLYDIDIEDYYLGVVPDVVNPLFISNNQKQLNTNIPYDQFGRYFCAGVLLVNIKKFNKDNIIEKYFDIASKEIFHVCDQDILNTIFSKEQCLQIDQKYNVIIQPPQAELDKRGLDCSSDLLIIARNNTVIRHYADIKPWEVLHSNWANYVKFQHVEYWFFAKMTPFYEGLHNQYLRSIFDANVKYMIELNKKKQKKSYYTIIKKFLTHIKNIIFC